jgi:hypothetical protein
MTIMEDPHDSWAANLIGTGRRHERAVRTQFWLTAMGGLAVFWSAVAWMVLRAAL